MGFYRIEQVRGLHVDTVLNTIKLYKGGDLPAEAAWDKLNALYTVANNGERHESYAERIEKLKGQEDELQRRLLDDHMICDWFARYANTWYWPSEQRDDESGVDYHERVCWELNRKHGGEFKIFWEY